MKPTALQRLVCVLIAAAVCCLPGEVLLSQQAATRPAVPTSFIPRSQAVSTNTANTVPLRDGSGNFAAGTITAALSGNASTATSATNFSGSLAGDVTGTQGATVVSSVNLISCKLACRVASIGNMTLTTLRVIDGVQTVDGDRVLCKNQGVAANNGPWIVHTGAWTRPPDFNSTATALAGCSFFIAEGATQSGSAWTLATTAPITVGTTGLTFYRTGNIAADVVMLKPNGALSTYYPATASAADLGTAARTAIAAAGTTGTVCLSGTTFDFGNTTTLSISCHVVGKGRGQTILSSTLLQGTDTGLCFGLAGTSAVLEDLTLTNPTADSYTLIVGPLAASVSASMRRVTINGSSDGLYSSYLDNCYIKLVDVTINTHYDTVAILGSSHTGTIIEAWDSTFSTASGFAGSPTGYAHCIVMQVGTFIGHDCKYVLATTAGNVESAGIACIDNSDSSHGGQAIIDGGTFSIVNGGNGGSTKELEILQAPAISPGVGSIKISGGTPTDGQNYTTYGAITYQNVNLAGNVTGSPQNNTVATVGGSTAADINTVTALVKGNTTANYVLAGPASGSAAAMTKRPMVEADLPTQVFVGGGMVKLTGVKFRTAFWNAPAAAQFAYGGGSPIAVPSGKRWLIASVHVAVPPGGTSTSVKTQLFDGASTYYSLGPAVTASSAGANVTGSIATPFIFEAGDYLAINVINSGGAHVWVNLIEFDNTCPLKTVRMLTMPATTPFNNTLYTVPAGKTAFVLDENLMPNFGGTSGLTSARIFSYNFSGGSLTHYAYVVPSGGSAPTLASTPNLCGTASVNNDARGSFGGPACLNDGDSIVVQPSAATATQYAWATIVEH